MRIERSGWIFRELTREECSVWWRWDVNNPLSKLNELLVIPRLRKRDRKCHHVEISYVSTLGSLSDAFAENSGFKHGSVIVNIFADVTLSLSALQVYVIKERCRFSQINFFIEYFHIGPRFCLFPANLMSSANRVKNYPFWWCTDRQRPGSSPSLTANWMKRKRRQKGLRRGKKKEGESTAGRGGQEEGEEGS